MKRILSLCVCVSAASQQSMLLYFCMHSKLQNYCDYGNTMDSCNLCNFIVVVGYLLMLHATQSEHISNKMPNFFLEFWNQFCALSCKLPIQTKYCFVCCLQFEYRKQCKRYYKIYWKIKGWWSDWEIKKIRISSGCKFLEFISLFSFKWISLYCIWIDHTKNMTNINWKPKKKKITQMNAF